MKLPGLIIALGLILAPRTKGESCATLFASPTFCHPLTWIWTHRLLGFVIHAGENWGINVTKHIYATLGSNVTIQCSFSFPSYLNTGKVRVYWKRTTDTFVYHANESRVLERYRGKTHLIGNKDQGNCSLMIQNIREEDRNIYLRISVNGTPFSFSKDPVSIFLSGEDFSRYHACLLHNRKVHTDPDPPDKSQIKAISSIFASEIWALLWLQFHIGAKLCRSVPTNSLTSSHLFCSQWQVKNGQSPSLVWPLWHQLHFWLFLWQAEFFVDWNAKGSIQPVYFREQVFVWLWGSFVLSKKRTHKHVAVHHAKSKSFHFTFLSPSSFLRTITVTRDDSRHYANVTRTLSNQAKRFVSGLQRKIKRRQSMKTSYQEKTKIVQMFLPSDMWMLRIKW